MSISETEIEEVTDKLQECLNLLAPYLEAGSLELRAAVDKASKDPDAFARAFLQYLGTDSMEDFIEVLQHIFGKEGSHK